MTNPQRGEVSLVLDGRTLALAPSFALIAELEESLGPLPAVLRRLASREDWPAHEVGEVLRLAGQYAPGAPAPERLEVLLLSAGLSRLRAVALELLVNALAGMEGGQGTSPGKPPAASTGGG